MQCRCGHGRGQHRRASGKKRLPCQAIYRGHRIVQTSIGTAESWPMLKCKCRDWHPKEA